VGTVDNVFKYGKCFHLSLSAKVTAHSRWDGGSVHGLLWDQVLAWSRRRCVEVGLMCIFTVKAGEKEKQPTKPKPNNPYLATPSLQNTCVCGGCGCALRGAFSATAQSIWSLVF